MDPWNRWQGGVKAWKAYARITWYGLGGGIRDVEWHWDGVWVWHWGGGGTFGFIFIFTTERGVDLDM